MVLLLVATLAVALSALLGAAVREAVAAAGLLREARTALTSADDPSTDDPLARLDAAGSRLQAAAERLDRPAPRFAAALPLLGRSWTAERRAVDAALTVVDGAGAVAQSLPSLRRAGGGFDLAALERLADALDRRAPLARAALQRLAATPTGATPGAVSRGVEDAVHALTPAVEGLEHGADGARLAASLLGAQGPRTVLVALQNNAELRGSGGYVSTFSLGTAADGRLDLGAFRDVDEVLEPRERARPVPAPPELVEDFGVFLADTTLWRTWTMSPHVPDTAAVGAEVAATLTGQRPSVVLLLDVPAVVALTRLTGLPVELPGGEQVPAERLLDALLVETYGDAGADPEAQAARRAGLRAAAARSATAVLTSDLDLTDAVRELGSLARGRHLSLWSAEPAEQEQLEQLGLAGSVEGGDGDLLHVSVNNLSGNKLDRYVSRDVVHDVELSGQEASVRTRVRLTSTAPEGLVPYVTGVVTPGRSSLRVEFSLPVAAEFKALTVDGATAEGDVRFGAERARAFTYLDLALGQRAEVEVRYTLPVTDGTYDLRALPQALAQDATLEISVDAADGALVTGPDGPLPPGTSLLRTGPWALTESWEVAPAPRSIWDRLREFWTEPVELG